MKRVQVFCDLCGDLALQSKDGKHIDPKIEGFRRVLVEIVWLRVDKSDKTESSRTFDLCPSCLTAFTAFLEPGSMKKEKT